MSYLEELLNRCDSLADQATILLAELEKEVAEIERQDAPTFEMVELKEKLYNENSGRCFYCGEDTLWGDAPHAENCRLAQVPASQEYVWVGFEPSLYSQSQEWQQQDYGFSRGSFA